MIISLVLGFVGFDPLMQSFGLLDARIITNAFPPIPEESLVHTLQRSIFLSPWLLDAVLMVLMVLIL